MRILFIGDVVGNPGRKVLREIIPKIKAEKKHDFCIANAENAAGGSGLTYSTVKEIFLSGVDVITTGNHVWSKREVLNFIESEQSVLRPANYPPELPGKGSVIMQAGRNGGIQIGILNVMGRVYMDSIDCPFRTALKETEYLRSFTNIIIVDMHAEATSEKNALAWYLDGKVSCVIGTHTHIQTADERILPMGTGYITDAGMTGPHDGILGVDKDIILDKFLKHMPVKFEVAKGRTQFNGLLVDINESTGRTTRLERLSCVMEAQ